jgi:hypothetical protein
MWATTACTMPLVSPEPYLFEEEAEVEYSNTTITVPSQALKFSVEVLEDWPWLDTNNNLCFGMTFCCSNADGSDSIKELAESSDKKQLLLWVVVWSLFG